MAQVAPYLPLNPLRPWASGGMVEKQIPSSKGKANPKQVTELVLAKIRS